MKRKAVTKLKIDSTKNYFEDALLNIDEKANEYQSNIQYNNEFRLIQKNQKHCSLPNSKRILKNIDGIQTSKVGSLGKKQFYNANVMEAILCSMNTLFIGSDSIPINQRVVHWLSLISKFGSGVNGYALDASFREAKDLFIIKGQGGELVHEYFVGLQLNPLRNQIPNFAYIFGGFRCLPPLFDDKKIRTWCSADKKYPGQKDTNYLQYVVYEKISPSKTLRESLSNLTFDKFLEYYGQAMLAVRLAHETCDFTHYDLHDENLLLRQVPGKANFVLEYPWKNGESIYISTDRIATIIDYGMSHVRVDGKNYGTHHFQNYNIYPDKSMPLYDAYKLLCFCAYYMKDNEKEKTIPLFEFFSSDVKDLKDLNEYLETNVNYYFLLPPIPSSQTLDNYLDLMIRLYPNIFKSSVSNSDDILNCSQQICVSKGEVLRQFGLTNTFQLETLYDTYDFIKRNPHQEKTILKNKSLPVLIQNTQMIQQGLLETLDESFNTPIYSATTEMNFSRYKNYIYFMVQYKNAYIEAEFNQKMLDYFNDALHKKSGIVPDWGSYVENIKLRDIQIMEDYNQSKNESLQTLIKQYFDVYPDDMN